MENKLYRTLVRVQRFDSKLGVSLHIPSKVGIKDIKVKKEDIPKDLYKEISSGMVRFFANASLGKNFNVDLSTWEK